MQDASPPTTSQSTGEFNRKRKQDNGFSPVSGGRKQQGARKWDQNRNSRRGGKQRWEHNVATNPTNSASNNSNQLICSVCQKTLQPKYKCPKCRATYCGVECCRLHKEKNCKNSTETNQANACSSTSKYIKNFVPVEGNNMIIKPVRRHHDDHDDGMKITEDMKSRMHGNEWLRQELQDPGLRHLIRVIYEAPNNVVRRGKGTQETEQERKLEELMDTYPEFQCFLDKLKVLTGILERHGDASSTPLNEWLSQKDISSDNLTLRPLRSLQQSVEMASRNVGRPGKISDRSDNASENESKSDMESENESTEDESSGNDSSDSHSSSN